MDRLFLAVFLCVSLMPLVFSAGDDCKTPEFYIHSFVFLFSVFVTICQKEILCLFEVCNPREIFQFCVSTE